MPKKTKPKPAGASAWLAKTGRKPVGVSLTEEEYQLVYAAAGQQPAGRVSMAEFCRQSAVTAAKEILAEKQKSA